MNTIPAPMVKLRSMTRSRRKERGVRTSQAVLIPLRSVAKTAVEAQPRPMIASGAVMSADPTARRTASAMVSCDTGMNVPKARCNSTCCSAVSFTKKSNARMIRIESGKREKKE